MFKCNSVLLIYSINLLFLSTLIFSCSNRIDLEENELKVVEEFITTDWYDSKIRSWNGEDIPSWVSVRFFKVNEKLNFEYRREYSASFGDKSFISPHFPSGQSFEDQIIDIYYDEEESKVRIDLYDNKEKSEVRQGLYFTINKDSIIPKLTRQIELRNKITDFYNSRKITQFVGYDWGRDNKGVFEDRNIYRTQNQDFSFTWGFNENQTNNYYKLRKDDELIRIGGFYGESVFYILKEEYKYRDDLDNLHKLEDLKFKFSRLETEKIISLLSKDLSFYETNIIELEQKNEVKPDLKLKFKNPGRFKDIKITEENLKYYTIPILKSINPNFQIKKLDFTLSFKDERIYLGNEYFRYRISQPKDNPNVIILFTKYPSEYISFKLKNNYNSIKSEL